MTSSQRALAIAGVIGVGFAAGFLSYRLESARPTLRALPPPALKDASSAAAAAPEEQDAPPPASNAPVPTSVPALELPDLEGHLHSLRSFVGGPLILNFWATWCEPCRREIPLLQELRRTHRREHLEIVGIAIDMPQAVQDYVHRRPIDYPLLVGEKQGLAAAEQFGMEPVLPFSVFADAKGRILAVKIGELHREEGQFILDELQRLDQGQIELPQAREAVSAALAELAVKRAKLPARSPQDSASSGEN
jgi:thiol-disulfide isomerase/thioredoxin